jgi:hypothetical protein
VSQSREVASDEDIIEAVKRAVDAGDRDRLGGVHYTVLVDYVGEISDERHIKRRLSELADDGLLIASRGWPEDGNVRVGYLPRGWDND